MEELKRMKEALMSCVSSQIHGNLQSVDTKELGEAIDMIKDLSEAIYYCTITKAMESDEMDGENKGKGQHGSRYYTPMYRHPYPMTTGEGHANALKGYRDGMVIYPTRDMEDSDAGHSWKSRKMYMQGKYMGQDKTKQMQELEQYMQELSSDVTEMIQDSSPEEKQMLQQKLSMLAAKIK